MTKFKFWFLLVGFLSLYVKNITVKRINRIFMQFTEYIKEYACPLL